jgi:hypothetical protein
MMKKRIGVGLMMVVLASGNLLCASEFWNPLTWFQPNRADVLIVTGNYARSRLLAELVQRKTGQTILLVSPIVGGEELFTMPASSEAYVAEKKYFVDVVAALGPKKILFLGDSDYLPAEYIEKVRNQFPIVVIAGDDWQKNAEAVATLFRLRSVPGRYQELTTAVDAALGTRPGLTPVATPAVPVEAPAPVAGTEPELVPLLETPADATAAADPTTKKVTVQSATTPAAAGGVDLVPLEPVAPPRLAPPAK